MLKKTLIIFSLLIIFSALTFQIVKKIINPSVEKTIKVESINIFGIDNKDTKSVNTKSIKVLSANLIAEFETQPESSSSSPLSRAPLPPKIKSLRLVGELKNNGNVFVEDATPLITFYDAQNEKIAVKVANFSDGYFFAKLFPEEKYFYDVTVENLPENFQNLNISFEPSSEKPNAASLTNAFSKFLKIEARSIEENIATAAAEGQEFYYYRLKGILINAGEKNIKNAQVVVYALDKDSRVFAWEKQTFPSDLITKENGQNINILIKPFKNEKAENFEVFLFGEEL